MSFEFQRVPGEELGLEDAVTQALLAAEQGSDGPPILSIRDALVTEILAKQQAINHKHGAEMHLWKERLVQETGDLRKIIEDRRERMYRLLSHYWPGEFSAGSGDIVAFATLDRLVAQTFEKLKQLPSTSPHKPE